MRAGKGSLTRLCPRHLATITASCLPGPAVITPPTTTASSWLRDGIAEPGPSVWRQSRPSSLRPLTNTARDRQHLQISSPRPPELPFLPPLSAKNSSRSFSRADYIKQLVNADLMPGSARPFDLHMNKLDDLSEEELTNLARQIGRQGLASQADDVLEYLSLKFLRPRKRLQGLATSENWTSQERVRSEALAVARRTAKTIEALLESAQRISDDVIEDGTQPADRPTERTGIATVLSPDGVHRAFTLLVQSLQVCDETEQSGKERSDQYVFSFLSNTCCLDLLRRIVKAEHEHLLPVFAALHDELLHRSDMNYPEPADLSSILSFCLRFYQNGGSKVLTNSFDLLLDRPGIAAEIKRASEDLRALVGSKGPTQSPSETDEAMQIFSRCLLVRLELQMGDPQSASREVINIMRAWPQKALTNPQGIQRYLLNVAQTMIDRSQGSRRAMRESLVAAGAILTECANLSAAGPLSSSNEPILEHFCDASATAKQASLAFQVMLPFKQHSYAIHELVSPSTLVTLLQVMASRDKGASTRTLVSKVLDWSAETSTGSRSSLLDFPLLLRRPLIESLAKLEIKEVVASLWQHWASTNDPAAHFIVADVGLMRTMVKLFSRSMSFMPSRAQKRPQAQKCQSDVVVPPLSPTEEFAFAEHVLQAFLNVKSVHACDHVALTAIAAAKFDLGRDEDAFKVFAMLLHKRQVPDETDVMVLLHAMARRNVVQTIETFRSFQRGARHLPSGAATSAQHPSDREFVGKLQSSPSIVVMLLRHCLYAGEFSLAKDLVDTEMQQARRLIGRNSDFALTLKLAYEAFRAGSIGQQDRAPWAWVEIARVASQDARRLGHCKVDSALLVNFAHAAAHGVHLSQLPSAAQVQASNDLARRKKSSHQAQSARPGTGQGSQVLPGPVRDSDLLAAIAFLELAASQTNNLDARVVALVLIKIKYKAQSFFSGGGKKAERRPGWISALDRVVSLLRRIGDPEPAAGRKSTSLLNSNVFRLIIGAYVELRDWSGALQTRAWMTETLGRDAQLGAKLTARLDSASARLKRERQRLEDFSGPSHSSLRQSRELPTHDRDRIGGKETAEENEAVPRDKAWWHSSTSVLVGETSGVGTQGIRVGEGKRGKE